MFQAAKLMTRKLKTLDLGLLGLAQTRRNRMVRLRMLARQQQKLTGPSIQKFDLASEEKGNQVKKHPSDDITTLPKF